MLIKGSFEDYLYILVGLIWVAFSIYKGAKKNKSSTKKPQQVESGEVQEEKKSFFDDFLNQIINDDKQVIYETKEEEPATKEPIFVEKEVEEKVFSNDDVVEESNFIDDKGVYEIEPAKELNLQKELKNHLKDKNEQPKFDLKKAIIYSEILNRRYF